VAALVWLLLEGGLPILVCGPASEPDLTGTLNALLELRTPASLNSPASPHSPSPPRSPASPALKSGSGGANGDARPGRRPGTTLRASSLREAFEILQAEPFNLSDDELRALGIVVVLEGGRATAVHYVRPVERDKEGHLQRRPPAVLATWDPERAAFEHFAWAVTPELAVRVGRTQADLEEEQARRQASFTGV
jgi:hypothetical protein